MEGAGFLAPPRLIAGNREWAAGDRLVCRRNDYRLGVRNGTRGTVVEIEAASRALFVRTDEGVVLRLPEKYLDDAQYGYALTGHISQGATVERTYLLTTPERGGREWAYVASTRHRVDLALFVVHHESERLVAALARAWERSDAKHFALDLVDAGKRSSALSAARSELEDRLPERLAARAGALLERREDARIAARSEGELAARARHDAQRLTDEIRSVHSAISGWSAHSEIARPSAPMLAVFGRRPAEHEARAVWERAVGAVATYRHSQAIPTEEPTLLGPQPSVGEARSAWEAAVVLASEAVRTLRLPSEARARLAAVERSHTRVR